MSLNFNGLLRDAGLNPGEVRLLRHQTVLPSGLTPFDLWERDRAQFDAYQSYQKTKERSLFKAAYWASFVGLGDGRTMFAGVYEVGAAEVLTQPAEIALSKQRFAEAEFERYPLRLAPALEEYIGRLYIHWGKDPSAKRAWRQRADLQDKTITELHLAGAATPFPGYEAFMAPLSQLQSLPQAWVTALSAVKGIYLLTCPTTHMMYVGMATGADSFFGRWSQYAANGHGGNVMLKQRGRTDYRVSILEVAGLRASDADIATLEQRWKAKLGTRVAGLNAN